MVPGFVIQGGDPAGNGSGGPGYRVIEKPPSDAKYTRGVVAMAKTATEAPGSSGSQFFMVIAADAQLPPDYAVVGNVVRGDGVLSRIAAIPTGGGPTGEQPQLRVGDVEVGLELGGARSHRGQVSTFEREHAGQQHNHAGSRRPAERLLDAVPDRADRSLPQDHISRSRSTDGCPSAHW